jgi:hypothetical protein
MTPYLLTPPSGLPVSLPDLKAHLRMRHDEDDADLVGKQAGVVAALDGWGGILGRCILPQVWAVDVTGPGPHVLPFPDASEVEAVSGSDALAVEVTRTGLGHCVTLAEAAPGQAVTIRATYGLSAQRLPAAQSLIKLMVQREYDMLSGPDGDAITRTIQALVTALRWGRL